jgi:hypothetical protein
MAVSILLILYFCGEAGTDEPAFSSQNVSYGLMGNISPGSISES